MATGRFISILFRSVIIVVILLFSIAIVSVLVSTKPQLEIDSGERALPAVVVLEASPTPVARRTIGYGTADPLQHADIPARVSSTVDSLPATTRIGRFVNKGDLIIALDITDYLQHVILAEQALASSVAQQAILAVEQEAANTRLELAQQDQVLAETELSRITDAFSRGAAKQREVDSAKQRTIGVTAAAINAKETARRLPAREEQAFSAVRSRESDLALAKENLRRCNILSPIDGVLQEIDVRVGEHVQAGQRIARVVDSTMLEIPLRLPSHARSYIAIGDEVSLRSAGFGRRHWDARISRIAPEDDTQTRTMVVYVDIEQDADSSSRVPPGLFVRGEVRHSQDVQSRWIVPRRSLRDDRILVVRDGILRSLPVFIDFSITGEMETFGLPDQDWAVLDTPLSIGDLVVVDPGGSLRDGMSVRVILAKEVALK
jgi:multidrug efflux system membrane fusion protein